MAGLMLVGLSLRKRLTHKKRKAFTIAIDGPAGSGKSAVAEMLASRLSGFTKLDSGALYRSIALFVDEGDIKGGIESLANETIRALLDQIIFTDDKRVFVGNRDVTDAIRSPPISILTAKIAQIPQVRAAVVNSLRTRADNCKEGVVIEGRDTGSVVFPDAEVKVYLDASAEERAHRRQRQIGGDFAHTLADIKARDQADFSRKLDPLRVADGAVVMDSTGWSVEKTVDEISKLVYKRRPRTRMRTE
ncbi:Cytidylate kinase, putative [Perkinsus marinus ATCC 50983]|uniref:(d)CMP kinase n=1 Tax=Perkinsus marinus (strain ATCC 50983 / TXsc) TaxID=423536 RepID=C5KFN5_PERM5|nr:Cytidylate kinase, putative [Perkinsus marinus ATCC 50983]EER16712.1 Cytidylate kinase, putative [Perkinsus marinus ATCC 50983]|eukprot:XP_002784916.1 Cytidylate kinase, putative [Perkinsus marinus ATCC 50983]